MFEDQNNQEEIPIDFLCPITGQIMKDPVMTSDGCTFDRHAISAFWKKGKIVNPITNQPLLSPTLIPNKAFKVMIQKFNKKRNKKPYYNLVSRNPQIMPDQILNLFDSQKERKQDKPQERLNETHSILKIHNPYCDDTPEKKVNQTISSGITIKQKNSISAISSKTIKQTISLTEIIQQFQKKWEQFSNDTMVWLLNFKYLAEGLPSKKKYENGHYRGQLEGDKHYGYGIMTFNNGNYEYGEWKNGMLHGRAAQYIKKVSKIHSGIFQRNNLNGLGEIRDTKLQTVVYRGYFQLNTKQGFGIEFEPETKKTYKGYFVNGKKEGIGREYNYIGDYFEGQWVDDQKHGQGIRVKGDGQQQEYWIKGKEIGAQSEVSPRKKKRDTCGGCNHF